MVFVHRLQFRNFTISAFVLTIKAIPQCPGIHYLTIIITFIHLNKSKANERIVNLLDFTKKKKNTRLCNSMR